jgi:hypothetical protein
MSKLFTVSPAGGIVTHLIYVFLLGLGTILDGLVSIFTLGFANSEFGLRAATLLYNHRIKNGEWKPPVREVCGEEIPEQARDCSPLTFAGKPVIQVAAGHEQQLMNESEHIRDVVNNDKSKMELQRRLLKELKPIYYMAREDSIVVELSRYDWTRLLDIIGSDK